MKKVLVIILILALATVFFAACKAKDAVEVIDKIVETGESLKTTLSVPANVRVEGGTLTWNPVEHASRYKVSIDGREYYADDFSYVLPNMVDGDHTFKVCALGDDVIYISSAFSENLVVTFKENAVTRSGYYSQFDDLTKEESFLGYGFDVINSAVFCDRYAKTSYPIFKTDELMNLRLLKVDSKANYITEIESEDLKEFMHEWNVNANVGVNWGGAAIGGSVQVEAKYSGGHESTQYKYYHAISIYNQKFYIVMQGDLPTYQSILSEGFKRDLYSNMSPADLFNKYGTHFITSAVMGGRINSYYLYTSDETSDFHDVCASVSVEVRKLSHSTDVGVSGGYRQQANEKHIQIKNTLEVIGGGDYGLLNDADIGYNYLAWEKSLDDHASLMAIKDSGSLASIWSLIDPAEDTGDYYWDYKDGNGSVKVSRAQQLEAYFYQYGVDSYNNLMKAAGLPEIVKPTAITDIRVNGQTPNESGDYEVFSGTTNNITFAIEPENAYGAKSIGISTQTDYARLSDDGNGIVIDHEMPGDSVLRVIISAGDIKKTIRLRVTQLFNVELRLNNGSLPSEVQAALKNLPSGTWVETPQEPAREGYVFKGWYSDARLTVLYEETAIEQDFNLYAKWEVKKPRVIFETIFADVVVADVYTTFRSAARAPRNPEKVGYTFIGWYVDDFYSAEYDFSTILEDDIVLYAKWMANPKVSFATGFSDVVMEDVYTVWHSTVKAPRVPEKTGYVFLGWYIDYLYSKEFDFNTILEDDLILYAKWIKNPEVHFYTGFSDLILQDVTTTVGSSIREPEKPVKYGYVFQGWYVDASYSKLFDFASTLDHDITLYAKWEMIKYTVHFNTNGGTPVPDQTTTWQQNYKLQRPKSSKDFCAQPTWYKDAEFLQEFLFKNSGESIDSLTEKEDGMTLYAKWEPKTVTIHLVDQDDNGSVFDARGFAIADKKTDVTKGFKIDPVVTPVKEGYTFDCWYRPEYNMEIAELETVRFEPQEEVYYITVYAVWKPNTYTVTYTADLGSGLDVYEIAECEYGEELVQIDGPNKPGYAFVEWKYGNKEVPYYMPAQDITLTAVFEIEEYTLTYKVNGVVRYTERYTYGEQIVYCDKYDFYTEEELKTKTVRDWRYNNSTDLPVTMPDKDITVSGGFDTVQRAVHFVVEGDSAYNHNVDVYYDDVIPVDSYKPMKEGYEFSGWTYDDGSLIEKDTTMPNHDVTLIGAFSKKNYIVTLIKNNGNMDKELVVPYDEPLPEFAAIERAGYTLIGYYTALTAGTKVISADGVLIASVTGYSDAEGNWIKSSNSKLYAHWEVNTYSVVYDVNKPNNASGNVTGIPASDTWTYDENATLAAAPALTGWDFKGWYKDRACQNSAGDAETVLFKPNFAEKGSVTLYAKWEAKSYAVVYYGNKPEAASAEIRGIPSDVTWNYDDNEMLADAKLTGWTLLGWYDEKDALIGKGGAIVVNLVVSGSVKLFAKWQVNTYTVIYDGNKPTNASGNVTGIPASDTWTYDENATLGSKPTLTGWDFKGWYKDRACQNSAGTAGSVLLKPNFAEEGTVTLYAKWTPITYTVQYNGNRPAESSDEVKNMPSPLSIDLAYDTAVSLSSPTLTGYTLLGWNRNKSATTATYAPGAEIRNLTTKNGEVIILYPIWSVITYDVALNVNTKSTDGQSLVVAPAISSNSVRIAHNNSALILNAPSASCYKFLGWYSDPTGGTKVSNSDGRLVSKWTYSSIKTLYAHWEKTYSGYTYVSTKTDMNNIRNNPAGKYYLVNDLDLGEWNNPFGFHGEFNGGEHKITYVLDIVKKGIEKPSNNNDYKNYEGGLFNDIYDEAYVHNLKVNCTITLNDNTYRTFSEDSRGRVGGVAGCMWSNTPNSCPTIRQVTVEGSIVINNETVSEYDSYTGIGGIVGVAYCGTIDKCKSTVRVFVKEGCAGGVVGKVWLNDGNVTITNCTYVGAGYDLLINRYDGNSSKTISVCSVACLFGGSGGIIGHYKSNNKNYSFTTKNLFVNSSVGRSTGGGTGGTGAIVGKADTWNYWTIENCYYTNHCGYALDGNSGDFSNRGMYRTTENKDQSGR